MRIKKGQEAKDSNTPTDTYSFKIWTRSDVKSTDSQKVDPSSGSVHSHGFILLNAYAL
jgi:hypothetical protein